MTPQENGIEKIIKDSLRKKAWYRHTTKKEKILLKDIAKAFSKSIIRVKGQDE